MWYDDGCLYRNENKACFGCAAIVLVGLCSCRKMAFVARAAGKQQKIHSFAPLSEGVLMMEGNILKRDRQQFQINEELDLRTRLLMREAECIIKVIKKMLLYLIITIDFLF
jgi:hypothetical protein